MKKNNNVRNSYRKEREVKKEKKYQRTESFLKIDSLNSKLYLLIRTINLNFDFKEFTKKKLMTIEIVS